MAGGHASGDRHVAAAHAIDPWGPAAAHTDTCTAG